MATAPHAAPAPRQPRPPSVLRQRSPRSTYPHISAWGTHHGRCWRRHDGGRRDGVGERREGVLVRVLVRVLVLVLVLVELGPQVGRRAQGSPAVSTLRRQETRVQLLPQEVLLCKGRAGTGWRFLLRRSRPSGRDVRGLTRAGTGPRVPPDGRRTAARGP